MGFMRRGSGRDYYPFVSGILGTLGTVGVRMAGSVPRMPSVPRGYKKPIMPNYRKNPRQITEKYDAKLPKIEIIN